MGVRVQSEDFDVGAELARLGADDSGVGAVASFVGIVRDARGEGLTALTLEHYPGMTERMLAEIEAEARQRFDLRDALVVHRVGRLEIGARIVLVVAAAAHREAAFAGCAFMMDWLKTKAPFWKKEEGRFGERWVEARTADDVAASRWDSTP